MDKNLNNDLIGLSVVSNIKNNFPNNITVIDLFLAQVERAPNNDAIVFNDKKLSYKQLDELSNQLASYLTLQHKVGANDFIGLMIDRSEWLIIAMLAIVKTGSAYVPIDVDYPQKRKDYILNDSNCKIIIDSKLLQDFLSKQDNFEKELKSNSHPNPEDLIYIIYTSGTTGNPKGVMIEQRSVVNLIHSQTGCFNIDHTEKILQFSNYCFDASVEQIFLALSNGATLYMIGKDDLKNHQLPSFIEKNDITHLHATPSYLETLSDLSKLKSLKRIIAGGETCSLNLAKRLSKVCDFYNEYGPTETTVTSTILKFDANTIDQNSLSIGKPIANTEVYILSESQELVKKGEIGELCLSGEGLARGYLNKQDLTEERFIDNPYNPKEKLYRTGDHAKINEDGTITFIGRKDDQVKVRGYRIELGEIEAALNGIDNVKRAVVNTFSNTNELQLAAYVETEHSNFDSLRIRQHLSELVPQYMLPSIIMQVDSFAMTPNGKIDKKNLPEPVNKRPESAPPLRKPQSEIQKTIAKIWQEQLMITEIGVDDNFFEMGGTSLLTQKVALVLTQILDIKVPVTKLYQFPTIAGLSKYIEEHLKPSKSTNIKGDRSKKRSTGDIAVIGMAGRFPGANTIEELWEVLRDGKETISFFSPEELDQSIPETLKNDPQYVPARGIVPSAKEFDAKFFGINLKLAEAMDPQHRLFLEICWEALEQAGHLPRHYDGRIGVYAGSGTNSYYINNVVPNKRLIDAIGAFQATTVNDKDYIASRISYHLNLKGPAVSVHSACSTSLLAIAEAVDAIRNGHCEAALAGGSSITSPMNSGHLYQEGSMLSSNGRCRSFDAKGEGTIFSDGAGVVLLKDLELAKEDGDTILGVIKGIGLNNDGGNKGSFTAPSVEGEAGAIKDALTDAKINPSEISYIETHGTATPLGDPIEIEGLNMAFGHQDKNQYCAIGSIKSNMGHCTAAAGVAGFIKIILAMKHGKIPASLGYENPNPVIDFENSPFYVNDKLTDWNSGGLRKAGVSSFGVGGTNVHVVVEEYENNQDEVEEIRPVQLFTWSAKAERSLYGYQKDLCNFMQSATSKTEDIAYALANTREVFGQRSFVVVNNNEDASNKLCSLENKSVKSKSLKTVPNHLTFLFPGQGAQYLDMGKALYENEVAFRKAFDECAKILMDELQLDIKEIIYPEENSELAETYIKNTKYTQPALFVIEYALAQLFKSWNIRPSILIGHSIGEFVAAHLAGIMTLKDAVCLVAKRGKLVSELPGGRMLSVRSSAESIEPLLPNTLSIAAINSDKLCVVSGPENEIEAFSEILKEKGIANMVLLTSHAFHSAMMDPALEDFKREVEKIKLSKPQLPIISTVTGEILANSDATDVNYWVNHLRAPVDFSAAMDTMLTYEDAVLLEVGPGRALTTLSKQKKGEHKAVSISSLTIPDEENNSYHTVLEALGNLWLNGIEPNWNAFYNHQRRPMIALPSYVFDRKPCWAEQFNPYANTVNVADNYVPQITDNNSLLSTTIIKEQTTMPRKEILLNKISEIILNTSGIEPEASDYDHLFLELGLDSLVLTQMAITCKNEFGTPITFRQLNGEFGTPNLLAEHLDTILPKDVYKPQVNETSVAPVPQANYSNEAQNTSQDLNTLDVIAQQLKLLSDQVNQLQGGKPVQPKISKPIASNVQRPLVLQNNGLSEDEKKEHSKPFGASPKIEKQADGMTPEQEQFLNNLIASYNAKTKGSKDYTQEHRGHMSDPRVVSGFKPLTKELVYPLVVGKSSGNRLWDVDNNEYIDTLNGFGSCLFGHQPEFIKEALHNQIESGYEVGPQHPLAGEVCQMLCEMTGHDRAALCNTGSEAVLGAMRIARTVTGRSLIVAFSRSYHGINDEVIVRGSRIKKTFPAAPGILPEAVQNMLILDYGTEESLNIIRERAHEIAAVLVEPVQSRRPEFQPIEFLKEVREITKASDTTLIFDEIITGFRMHPGGAQALFGIKADVATYGKVIGGGISIGAIVGQRKYMDALDGGDWQYGDDSYPEVGVTYFAGTFVRHPLALASTKASLTHLKENSPQLQDRLAMMTKELALQLNSEFRKRHLPIEVAYYRSLWRLKFLEEVPYSELLFVLMRQKGIHIWDGFPCYMTEAFTEKDVLTVVECFIKSIDELTEVGIFKSNLSNITEMPLVKLSSELNQPPVFGAKLGLDTDGNPAWFVEDENNEGNFVKIEL